MKIKSFIRFFRRSLFLLTCLLIPLIIFLLLLPTLVSTPPVISRLQIAAGSSLGRSVILKDLQWSWLKGITLSGLEIAEDPHFGDQPLLRLNKLRVSYTLAELFSDTLALEVEVSGLAGRMITDGEGRNNIDSLLGALVGAGKTDKEKEPVARDEEGPLALPLDIQARILLDDISFEMRDERQNLHLSVEDFSLHLEVPSLLHQPVELEVKAPRVLVNENRLEPISLHFFLADLFQNDNMLAPQNCRVMVNGRFPGIGLDIQGGPLAKGVTGKIWVDPARLLSSFKPLLPPDVPEVSGKVELDLTGSYDPENSSPLEFDLLLSGKDIAVQPAPPSIPRLDTDFSITLAAGGRLEELLAVDLQIKVNDLTGSGAPLPESGVGPLNLALGQHIFLEQAQDRLRIEDGRIQIGEKSFLDWGAELSELQSTRAVQFTLHELHFDLAELTHLAEPWIPPSIVLGNDQGTGTIGIAGLHFKGDVSGGPAELDLEDLHVALPGLRMQQEELDIKAENIALQLDDLKVFLENNFPTTINLSLGASINGFSMAGGQAVSFDNLELRDVRLSASRLVPDPLSPYSIRGLLVGGQQLHLKGLTIPGQLTIPDFTEEITLETQLGEGGDASLSVQQLTMRAPSFTLMGLPTPDGNKNGSLTTSLAVDLQLEQIKVPQGEVAKTEAGGLAMELRLGEMLNFNFQGSLDELGTKGLRADFGAQIDLREASTVADALLPPGLSTSGNISFHGLSRGRVPLPAELQLLQNVNLAPGKRFADLSFAEQLLFTVELKDINLDLPGSDNRYIQVRNGHTASPLFFELKGADKRFSFGGGLKFPEIRQLPPAEDIPENLAMNLEFSGTTAELNFFEMREKFELQPLGVQQAFTLRLENMDALLSGELPLGPALMLHQINLDINNHLELNRGPGAGPISSTISLGGGLNVDMNLKLRGGESTTFGVNLGADGLHFAMRDKLELSGFDADFLFDKNYRLVSAPKDKQPLSPPPLSLDVLVAASNTGPTESTPKTFSERFRRDAKQAQPTFALQSFRLLGEAPRIELTDSTVNIKFVDSLPVIDNVELNILGGTV